MHDLTRDELATLKRLNTPQKIQDFLDRLPINFERKGETYMSPRRVLREKTAHCFEGALLAAAALQLAGERPLVLDLKATDAEDDHIVAVFQLHGRFGAISKSNHATVRYRDPVYASVRELAMSYFHEYTDPKGNKVLRSYSPLIDLSRFDARGWMTDEKDLWYIVEHIDHGRHYPLLGHRHAKQLRRADHMERKIATVTEWPENR